MDEPGQGRYLTRHDLETVIRRAAELEAAAGSTVPELSEADVVRIAHEVGLSEANIRRALAEHGGGGGLLAERGWISGVCGPGLLTASRVVQRPAEEVKLEMEAHFESNESLRLVRRTRTESLWEPDKGVVASFQRGLSDLFGRGYQLAKKGRVGLQVVPLSEESCQVSMTMDLCTARSGWFWGLGVAVGAPVALMTIAVVFASPIPDVWVALAPAPLAATLSLARAGYRRALARVRLILDGLLDRVEHDDPLEPRRTSWRDLLQ
jgi:hypothetical protein